MRQYVKRKYFLILSITQTPHIIAGLYESENNECNFLVSNETDSYNYLYREQLEVIPRDRSVKNTDEYTKILHTRMQTNNYLKTIWVSRS